MTSPKKNNLEKLDDALHKIIDESLKDADVELRAIERAAKTSAKYNEKQVSLGKIPEDIDVQSVVDFWHRVALGKTQFPLEFAKFVALWQAFNGLLNLKYPEITHHDNEKVRLISNDAKMLRAFDRLLSEQTFVSVLDEVRRLCPMYDVEAGQRRQKFSISQPYTLQKLLNLLYHIRCNLFHGEKNGGVKRDRKIVELAYEVLLPLFKAARSELFFVPHGRGGE